MSIAMSVPAFDIPLQARRLLAQIEDTHVLVQVTPHADEDMAYELSVPKSWAYSREFGPVTRDLLETQGLGFFVGPSGPGSPVVAVTVTRVPFEIPLDTWAKLTLVGEGFRIALAEWRPGPRGLFFDVMAWREQSDGIQLRRTTVRVDGSRIFCVNCSCARQHWDSVKETFWLAHLSFKLASGSGQTRMEPWLKAVSRAPVFVFAYPRSWAAEPVPVVSEHVSGVDVRLTDAEQSKLLGYLQIRAAKGPPRLPDLAELDQKATARLQRSGIVRTGVSTPLDATEDPRSAAVEGWLGGSTGLADMGGSETTVRLGWLEHSGRLLSFVALSPPMARAPLIALRVQRTFEIARASLQLGS